MSMSAPIDQRLQAAFTNEMNDQGLLYLYVNALRDKVAELDASGGAMAIGGAITGATNDRLLYAAAGLLANDDDARFDGANMALGGVLDSNNRLRIYQSAGNTGLLVSTATAADQAQVSITSQAARILASVVYGDSQAGNVGGATKATWAHLLGFNASGLAIGNIDGAPTKFIAGNNADRAAATGVLSSDSTATGNVGAGEDVLKTRSIVGSTLHTNEHGVWIKARLNFAANANSKQVLLKFGATTVYDSTATVQNGGSMYIYCLIIRTGAATQIAEGFVLNTAGTPLFVVGPISAAPGETLSGAVALTLSAVGVADNDITGIARFGWESV